MPRYRTKALYCTGPAYLPVGSVLALTESEAARHLAQGTIELVPEPAAAPQPEPTLEPTPEPPPAPKPALVSLPSKPEARRG